MTTEETREKLRQADHDLLIKVDVKVTDIASDIKEMKENTTFRMSNVEEIIKGLDVRTKVIEGKAGILFWLFAPIYLGIIGYLVSQFVGLFN